MSDVTRILNSLGSGDSESADDLLPLVYVKAWLSRQLKCDDTKAEKN